jgi:hypothetical protein
MNFYHEENFDTPLSSLIKHLCVSMWLMSHFKTSMQGKMGVLVSTICRYDCQMFENTVRRVPLHLNHCVGHILSILLG